MKTKKILTKVENADYGHQKVITIPLDFSTSQQLCLTLLLLKEKLLDDLELKFENFSLCLKLEKSPHSSYSIYSVNDRVFYGLISKNDLGYIIIFLLGYFRDNIGEAKHIDIDFQNKKGEEVTLTITCKEYKMYSPEEMKKMLDI